MLYLGFDRDVSEAALRLTGGDVQSATQLLLDNQGVLSPELLSVSPPSTSSSSSSPSSEEPSTSSGSTGRTHLTHRKQRQAVCIQSYVFISGTVEDTSESDE